MPALRTDLATVLVFRRTPSLEFLLLRRTKAPMLGSWQPIMGAIEPGETAVDAALRELAEETGLSRDDSALRSVWSLDQVRPFYIAASDAIVLSPTFAAEADPAWTPRLNDEHDLSRWVAYARVHDEFCWPGHAEAAREIAEWILRPGSSCAETLRVHPPPRRP